MTATESKKTRQMIGQLNLGELLLGSSQKATKETKGSYGLRSLRLLLWTFPIQDFNPTAEVRLNRSQRRGQSQWWNSDGSSLTALLSVPSVPACAGGIGWRAQSNNLTL